LIQGGGAAGGAGTGLVAATVGLAALDGLLLGYDLYESYQLGIAYGWWKPAIDSGNMQQVAWEAQACILNAWESEGGSSESFVRWEEVDGEAVPSWRRGN
jgi:hypothetical protein